MVSLPGARPRYRPDIPRRPRTRGDGPGFREDLLLYGVSFVGFLAAGVFFFYILDVYNRDALSRTMDAHNVLYSRDPHLGAIGLVWPPIPTMIRVLLLPAMSPFGLAEFSGPVASVIASAGCVVVLNRILQRFGLSRRTRALWVGVTMLNPVVLYHFSNGTAESLFALCFLIVLLAALSLRDRPEKAVLGMGLAAGLALWVRYEALAILGMAVVGYLWIAYVSRREGAWRDVSRIESLMVTLIFPSAFLGILWLSFNYTAEGDPLFFYHGPYSINAAPDVARNAADHPLAYAYGSPAGTMRYMVERALQLSFLFPVAAASVAVVSLRRREPAGTVLVLLCVSTLIMQAYQTFTGTIAPWLRYWVYLPLFTPILLAWLARAYPFWLRSSRVATSVRILLIPALFLLGNLLSYVTMADDEVGADEQLVVDVIAGNTARVDYLRVNSDYPDREVLDRVMAALDRTEGTILVDLQNAAVLVVEFEDADRFVINTDRDFDQALEQPVGSVDYVLLPNPTGEGVEPGRDAIYTQYPTLYEGTAWLKLEQEFNGATIDWRLYRVIDGTQTPEAGQAGANG